MGRKQTIQTYRYNEANLRWTGKHHHYSTEQRNCTKSQEKNNNNNNSQRSKMDSIEKAIRSWTMRNLSMVGKKQIVKSLLVSKFKYIGSIVDLPQVFINCIMRSLNLFGEALKKSNYQLWYNDEGGLKILNFKLFLDSLITSWLKKFISPGKDTWKIIPLYNLNKTHS